MAEWVAISSLATAGGTLALAGATFAAVRSSNRSSRVAERTLLAARLALPPERILSGDHEGGQRVVTRFLLSRREDGVRMASAGRH